MTISFNPKYTNDTAVKAFVEALPSRFDKAGDTLYADRNVIKSFDINSSDEELRRVVVKRYKLPNLAQRIAYGFFRASKARRAFQNAAELRARSIDTPEAIACIEERKCGLFRYGYLITTFDDAPAIEEKLTLPKDFDRIMAADFARFTAMLHNRGVLHHDLNCTNVRYRPDGGHYRFSVIDINRMRIYPYGKTPSDWACMENMTRFCGRMDLFRYVAEAYASARHWSADVVAEMIHVKRVHDQKWQRRKNFLLKLKRKR